MRFSVLVDSEDMNRERGPVRLLIPRLGLSHTLVNLEGWQNS
jgi:hypothetical protein